MAITNAQQYQQLVNKPANGKRPGYKGRDRDFQQRGASKSDYAKTSQSYKDSGTQQVYDGSKNTPNAPFVPTVPSEAKEKDNPLNFLNPLSNQRRKLAYNLSMLTPGQRKRSGKMQRARINYLNSMGLPIPPELEEELPSANFFVGPAFDKTSPSIKDPMTDEVKRVKTYGEQIAEEFGAPGVMMSGNVGGLEKFVKTRNPDGSPATFGFREKTGGGDGMSDYERRLLELEQAFAAKPETPEVEDEIINYRLMAGGGMADETVGGIMDLESSRQMYGLGKLVKKIGRSVKKIAKSPIGKAALAFGAYKLGSGFLKNKGIMGSLFGQAGSRVGQSYVPFKEGILTKLGLTKGGGSMMPTFLGGIAASTLGSYFMTPEEEEEQKLALGADIDDPSTIMNNPYNYINRRLVAEGGSIEKEPVAKKVMPLLDMDGKEKDYRETGGFVDMGRMEKADDVPARLSKNEFVFTADAVRNAGDGSVDKGAEVMYNMMKNLESGGEVSEESQGLEGARKMFQTSQRLEEVL